jgi:hypothetical protein
MKDPAFLFYSQDFYTGVATLTMEDRGKYITLLCLMHQQGRMTEETIRFLVGSVSDNLKSKFRIDEKGLWFNERLELESEKRSKFTESRRINGEKGGRPKEEIKPNGKPTKNHKDNLMEDENDNDNDNKEVAEIKVKYTADFIKFWEIYPLKEGKKPAFAKWQKAKDRPNIEIILAKIELQKNSEKWQKGFIPMPETYIHNSRWDDEIKTKSKFQDTW